MRRTIFNPVVVLVFVLAANGLWLPLHFAVAHAPAGASHATDAQACDDHHHDHHHHGSHHLADAETSEESPAAPEPHDCDICDLLLTFSAAEVETGAEAPPLQPLAVRVDVAPERIVSLVPIRSLGARAPPLG